MLRILASLLVAAGLSLAPASAQTPGQPKGEVILEIAGEIAQAGKTLSFDREMLEAVGLKTLTTTTPWLPEASTFQGVPLDKLMASVGARGKTLRVIALNDYAANIPMADLAQHGPILAIRRNGNLMPIRDKGPLLVLYPYDTNPELKSQLYYGRSVWQVKRIDVLP